MKKNMKKQKFLKEKQGCPKLQSVHCTTGGKASEYCQRKKTLSSHYTGIVPEHIVSMLPLNKNLRAVF